MARLDEKNVASVKKTVSVAGPTGGILSAYDKAAAAKFVKGGVADKAANAAVGTMMAGRAAAAQGRGGQTTGKKATAAKGTGGNTMGKKAVTAQGGNRGLIVQAIKNKLTGTPVASTPAKTEELKITTVKLPAVFEVAGNTYNREDVLDAVKKAKSTYGANSNKYKSLLSSLSIREQGGQLLFSGREFKKPDLRKDAGKSYVDTAQTVLGNIPNTKRMSPSPYGALASLEDSDRYSDRETVDLLKQFGVRPDRNLGKDPKATNR